MFVCLQLESDSRSGSSLSLRQQLTNSHHRNIPAPGTDGSNTTSHSGSSNVHRSFSATSPPKPTSRRFSVGCGSGGGGGAGDEGSSGESRTCPSARAKLISSFPTVLCMTSLFGALSTTFRRWNYWCWDPEFQPTFCSVCHVHRNFFIVSY